MGLTFLDLFSGIGGFRLGMMMAGHKCLGHCEIDKFADKSYRAMHDVRGDEWFETDIRSVRAETIPKADVWCFGFPCQDISVAGKQTGFKGNRSSLFFTVTRLLRSIEEESRPKYLFIENVKNLLSVNRGYDFARLLAEMDEIGYDAEWDVLNSKHFGVPQNRERVFIIGHLRGAGTREVFPIGETDSIHNPTEADGEIYETAQCLTAGGNDKWNGNYIVKQVGNCMPTATRDNSNQGRIYDPAGVAPCLNKMEGGGRQPMIPISMTRGVAIPVLTPDRTVKYQNGRRFKENGEPMFTITSQDRHGVIVMDKPNQEKK